MPKELRKRTKAPRVDANPDTERVDRIERMKSESVSQLLFRTARLVNERALERLRDIPGMPPIRSAHTALFPHIGHEGTRPSELAARLGISKQAVGQLVDELEHWGVVERRPDPEDGRAKRIHFVRRGEMSLERGLVHLGSIDHEIEAIIGAARAREVRDSLRQLLAWLERGATWRSR